MICGFKTIFIMQELVIQSMNVYMNVKTIQLLLVEFLIWQYNPIEPFLYVQIPHLIYLSI